MWKEKLIFIGSMVLATQALAMNTGYYVGAALGQGHMNLQSTDTEAGGTPVQLQARNNEHLTGKFSYGYMSTPTFGVELSVTHYAQASWAVTTNDVASPNATISADALNWALRFDVPVYQGLDVVIKPGLAWVRAHYTSSSSAFQLRGTEYYFRPAIGAGLSYSITRHWTLDATVDRILGRGQLHNAVWHNDVSWYLPSLVSYLVGVTYSF